jgi:hypothetical protein
VWVFPWCREPPRGRPEGKALFQVVMSFVENDDYCGVVELVRASNGTLDLKHKCGFSVAPRLSLSLSLYMYIFITHIYNIQKALYIYIL